MKTDSFLEMLSSGMVKSLIASESSPSKGKPFLKGNTVWILRVQMINGVECILKSSRNSNREWASLDTLNQWLRKNGVGVYQVTHMEQTSE